jgi:hypothetical protein
VILLPAIRMAKFQDIMALHGDRDHQEVPFIASGNAESHSQGERQPAWQRLTHVFTQMSQKLMSTQKPAQPCAQKLCSQLPEPGNDQVSFWR